MGMLSVVVSDATPLIALAQIELLHFLSDLFAKVYVPRAVYEEITFHGTDRPGARIIGQAEWIVVEEVAERSRVEYLLTQMDIGEAEAIVLAEEIQAELVLLDERKGRAVAQRLGLVIIGTAGLLLLLKEQGKIAQIRPFLDKLRMLNFRLSDNVYHQVISQAGEE
ncbi:MAG: DUF3368 domain-containing protein [Chloroflexota bacterium]